MVSETPAEVSEIIKRKNLYLDVSCYAGANVHSAIEDMVSLANVTGVDVSCELNGVHTLARAGDDPKRISASWERALRSKDIYKHAGDDGR